MNIKLNNNSYLSFSRLDVNASTSEIFMNEFNELQVKLDSPERDYLKNEVFYCGSEGTETIDYKDVLKLAVVNFSIVSGTDNSESVDFMLTKEECLVLANYLKTICS